MTTQQYKSKCHMNTGPLSHGLWVTACCWLQKCSKCSPGASVWNATYLNKDCDIGWKMSGVQLIILNLLHIHCCKSWTSLTSLCVPRDKTLQSAVWAGHPLLSIIPERYWRMHKTARRKWERAHSCRID